jgi:hypothetical protein
MKTKLGYVRQPDPCWIHGAVVTVTVTLVSLAGCDGATGNVADGVGAPTVLQPADVHVIGTAQSIAMVEDLDVRADGRVWVLNSAEPLFVSFGPDGEVLREFGTRGGGPEEFRTASGFVYGGIEGEAWVLDVRRQALIRISQPGSAWSEIALPSDSVPPGSLMSGMSLLSTQVRTARLGDEILLARSAGSLGDGLFSFSRSIWGADILALDGEAGTVRSVVSLGDILGDPTVAFASSKEPPPMLLWFRLWAVCSGSEIRVYDRLRNEVRGFTGEGVELDPTPLPPAGLTAVTREQFARAIFDFRKAEVTGEVGRQLTSADSARLIKQIVREADWEPAQLAAILPRYVDFRCTDAGVIWIRPFDPDTGGLRGGRAWLRIIPDGAAEEIHFPDRFDPYRFTAERIWGVQRDTLDVASVGWIAVPGRR